MNRLIQNGHIIVDKLVTAKHTIVGEDVARSILKATTDEVTLPKKKYVDCKEFNRQFILFVSEFLK